MKLLTTVALVLISGCFEAPASESTSVSEVTKSKSKSVIKIYVNGASSDVLLTDHTTGTNGFLTASRDDVEDTSGLDFAYATASSTDPDVVILIQGAGQIPNSAYTASGSTAHLQVTTDFPVMRCEVNTVTADFTCDDAPPITFDLDWVRDGFAQVTEKTTRTETLGPVTTKYRGTFDQRSAAVNGTWDVYTAVNASGNLLDTQSATVIREITLSM